MAGCGLRSPHRAYEAAPTRDRRARRQLSLFCMAHAPHMRKRPPLCTWRAPLAWGGIRLAGEVRSIREFPCGEYPVLGGGRAPGVRVCPAPVYRDIAGGCPYPVAVIPPRLCLWRDAVCRVRTVFPGHGVQDTQRGAKGALPGTRLVFRRACLAVFAALA